MILTDLTIIGCDISYVAFDPIAPLSLLPIYPETLLLTIPNSAAALIFPRVKCTSQIPGVDAVILILGVAAVFLFLFLLSILALFSNRLDCYNDEETLSSPYSWMEIGDSDQDWI